MAFTPYHNITGSTGVNVSLLEPGDDASDIISILITNTQGTNDASVSLFIQDQPTAAASSTYYILSTIAIPADTSLLLNESSILQFDNSINGYGLYMTVGGSDTLDVMINR